MTKELSSTFVKDRDDAIIDFVKTGSRKKVKEYCEKYGVKIPENEKVFYAGIYKAAQECANIPEDVKLMAMEKCLKIGFSPFLGTKVEE